VSEAVDHATARRFEATAFALRDDWDGRHEAEPRRHLGNPWSLIEEKPLAGRESSAPPVPPIPLRIWPTYIRA